MSEKETKKIEVPIVKINRKYSFEDLPPSLGERIKLVYYEEADLTSISAILPDDETTNTRAELILKTILEHCNISRYPVKKVCRPHKKLRTAIKEIFTSFGWIGFSIFGMLIGLWSANQIVEFVTDIIIKIVFLTMV